MYKKFFIWVYLFFVLLLHGCSGMKSDITALYPQKSIKDFGGELFLTDVRTIREEGGFFYFNEYRANHIFVTDSLLNLTNFFGKRGKGPGEFEGTGSFFIQNDSLYIFDDGGMRLNVFTTDGEFKRAINLPHISLLLQRFAILKNRIFFPSPVRSNSDITIVNLKNGKIIDEIILSQDEESVVINNRTILHYHDQLIAINKSAPFIERFTATGEVLGVLNLTSIKELEPLWDHYKNHKYQNHPERYVNLFLDAYLDESFLYVLCAGWPGRDDFSYIIKLYIDKETIIPQNVFKIQGADPSASLFDSVALIGNKLIAVEGSTQTIHEFDLSVIN